MKKAHKRKLLKTILICIAIIGFILVYKYYKTESNLQGTLLVEYNYGREVNKYSEKFNLNADFIKALIMLESSGKKEIKPRFENYFYIKLKEVKEKKIESFEHITFEHVENATDDALKNMASSWGPFQLMGYKCTLYDIKIKDIRGDDAIYWGMKWINESYGDYLRNQKFKDAFHIHNTGQPIPKNGRLKTHDKKYIPNGLKYMNEFKNNHL